MSEAVWRCSQCQPSTAKAISINATTAAITIATTIATAAITTTTHCVNSSRSDQDQVSSLEGQGLKSRQHPLEQSQQPQLSVPTDTFVQRTSQISVENAATDTHMPIEGRRCSSFPQPLQLLFTLSDVRSVDAARMTICH